MLPPLPERPGARAASALLGAALAGGWTLHDLAMLSVAGDPLAVQQLLLPSLLTVLAGAVLGLLLGLGHRTAFAILLVLVVASIVPAVRVVPISHAQVVLPRAALLLALAHVAGRIARARLGLGELRFGLAAGALACVVKTVHRQDVIFLVSWLFVAGAILALGAGLVRRPALRRTLTAIAVALPFVRIVPVVSSSFGLPRPDQVLRAEHYEPGAPSLLLIVLDTVRADRLTPYGYARETTPVLDRFARERATLYTDVRSTTSWTLPAHASLLTGLPPAAHGATHPRAPAQEATALRLAVRPAQPLRPDVETLAERFAAAGYRTGAIVANHAYLDRRFGLDRGFEHYDDRRGAWLRDYVALSQTTGLGLRTGHLQYRDATEITDLALDWLAEEDGERPFFLLLNYMDAHAPHYPPAPYDRLFAAARPADPLRPPRKLYSLLYDRCLAYMDAQVGRLLRALDETGRLDRMAVIVTADHGESFGEHGYWSHAWTLYDEVLHVPLLVQPPGGRSELVDERPLSLMDVHDLALGLVGLPTTPHERLGVLGEWYHPEHPNNPDLVEWARAVGRNMDADLLAWVGPEGRKWIVGSDGSVEAYDLPNDPAEEHPLTLDEAERASALERARAWWAAHPPREIVLQELDAESLERLKGLGYAGDGE